MADPGQVSVKKYQWYQSRVSLAQISHRTIRLIDWHSWTAIKSNSLASSISPAGKCHVLPWFASIILRCLPICLYQRFPEPIFTTLRSQAKRAAFKTALVRSLAFPTCLENIIFNVAADEDTALPISQNQETAKTLFDVVPSSGTCSTTTTTTTDSFSPCVNPPFFRFSFLFFLRAFFSIRSPP